MKIVSQTKIKDRWLKLIPPPFSKIELINQKIHLYHI